MKQYLCLALFMGSALYPKVDTLVSTEDKFVQTQIGTKTYQLEISNTEARRYRGLSYRESMDQDKGMLFVFSRPGSYQFCMREMRIPLDFVWVNRETVVDIIENVPPPSVKDAGAFTAVELADKVIELNAGEVKASGIKTGDKIKFY